MTNTQRAAARLSLIFAAVVAGILNGSVLAAPVLIFMVYLLCVLVRQAQFAHEIYMAHRLKELRNAAALAR
jgi:hypothetical protein